jgi:hypothetical protein
MDAEAWAKVLVPVSAIAVPALKLAGDRLGSQARRQRIKLDIELMISLPENHPGRSKLEQHVDRSIQSLIELESLKRRDPTGIGVAFFFALVAVTAAYFAFRDDGSLWWLWLGAPCAVLSIVGFSQDAVRRERDERGRAIREPRRRR